MAATSKTVLITGCSENGIGNALAVAFQTLGYHVFATARDRSKMANLQTLSNITLLTLDITQSAHISAAVEEITKHGRLDILVNNAGRNHFMPILDENLDDVRNLFEINVLAPIALTQAFAPLLIQSNGTVAFITSISGYVNVPYMGTSYPLSKLDKMDEADCDITGMRIKVGD